MKCVRNITYKNKNTPEDLLILESVWRHLADPAHQEKLPDPAGFWVVELIAEGGGKAEVVEVAHSQVVRIL